LHDTEIILTYVSVVILAVFFVEQLLLIYELGKDWCKAMFVLDMFVIMSSMAIEILILTISGKLPVSATAGLLVLARTWRFARVGHGVFEATEHVSEVLEEDETVGTMKEAWAMLDGIRWKEIRMTPRKQLPGQVLQNELAIAESLAKNPQAVLRALSYAKGYKDIIDKKKRKKKGLIADKQEGDATFDTVDHRCVTATTINPGFSEYTVRTDPSDTIMAL
jgi:hypothetical protein